MKVTEAKFGFDEHLKSTFYVKCKMSLSEKTSNGKFPVGFGVCIIDKKPTLVAFIDEFKKANIIAIADVLDIGTEWVKGVIAQNGYRWIHTYYSDVEKVTAGMDGFMVPFTAEGFNEIADLEEWKEMLKILQTP